jgi:hypothetical protein
MRAIWIWIYLLVRRITGRYYQSRRGSAFPLDGKSPRRSIKMVQQTRITRQELDETYQEIRKFGYSAADGSSVLASAVLRAYLGQKWWDRHVMPNRKKKGFVTIDKSTPLLFDISAYRIMDLAEILFNLQYVQGFDECISRMRAGDIEGTHAELDLGRMLFLNQIRFRYVIPSGAKGGINYDVEIIYPNGTVVCGDAKCNIETTEFREKTIDDRLEKARSQLPDGRPGIIFLKFPPRWMAIPDFDNRLIAVARDFLRTTNRIVSVKFYTSSIAYIDGALKFQHAGKEVSNPITDFGCFQNWSIFRVGDASPDWNGGLPPWWQRIMFYPDGRVR